MQDKLILQKYCIIRELGSGATAHVYLVWYDRISQYRAVKQIAKKRFSSSTSLLHEAEILKSLKHPFIPTIYDVEEDDEYLYIVMEYMEGVSLISYYQNNHPIREQTIIQLIIQLCELMEYLHGQKYPILYLDLKPGNLIIKEGKICLIDFGTALSKQNGSGTREYYGTRGYAPPELYSRHQVDERADLYEVGRVLWYLMSGESLNEACDGHREGGKIRSEKTTAEYSKALWRAAGSALRHHACERPDSITRFKKMLKNIQSRNKKTIITGNRPVTIAVIGSEVHIGATHLALSITNYLKYQGESVLYVEQNERPILAGIVDQEDVCCLPKEKERHLRGESQDGTESEADIESTWYIRYHGCNMTSNQWSKKHQQQKFHYIVRDLGSLEAVLSLDQQKTLREADMKVVVVGGKLWELKNSIRIMQRWRKETGVVFLMNGVSAKQFHEMIPSGFICPFYRVPYLVDPFELKQEDLMFDLLDSMSFVQK